MMFDEGRLYQQSAPTSQVESGKDNRLVEYSPKDSLEAMMVWLRVVGMSAPVAFGSSQPKRTFQGALSPIPWLA